MQLTCPRCHHTLEFSSDRPSFCGYCGCALAETKALTPVDPEAPTLAPDPAAAGATERVPEVVGGYRLLRVLGGGGMGSVYEAEDTASGRRVALKLISPQYAGSADAVERFRQEGRLASALSHPRCVFVLAADEDAGRPYIVMELMPGSTLEDRVSDKGPLAPEDAITAILDVIEGLEEAHRHGVIHRDVKPSNCFVDADGRVKVGDFGLSKSLVGSAHLTRTGAFLGTPLYASPEQVKGEPLDPQTDVYSTAATLYFLLTGRAPFQSGDMAATVARIVSDPAPSMRSLRPTLDPRLDQVVLQGLERDRSRRWRDMAEFRAALQELLPGRLSIGGLGLRFGAFVIDWFVLYILRSIAVFILMALLGAEYFMRVRNDLVGWALQLIPLPLFVLYFGLLEGLWGFSAGKFLLRLRVRRARGGLVPGLARGLARAGACAVLFNLDTILVVVGTALFLPANVLQEMGSPEVALRYGLLLSVLWLGGVVAGIALMLFPMRRRNGYRGLHEFLSGTRVVLLPPAARRTALRGERFEPPLRPAKDLPERIGAFEVRGAVGGGAGSAVLVGRDSRLGRDVWIWLRPQAEPPLGDARRPLSRMTRLRWLACGTHGGARWDAFIAPSGSPLTELVRRQGRFSWPEVRPLLEGLTDELVEACEEGTVPDPLRPEQVWVQPNGAAQLLDMPWRDAPHDEPYPAALADEEPAAAAQRRAVALLGQVAALALEGAPRRPAPPRPVREEDLAFLGRPGAGPPPTPAEPIRAPLPGHAVQMLRRLLTGHTTCQKFRAALRDTRNQPAEVTRARRLGHVGVLAAMLLVGGCCMFPAGWWTEMMPGMMGTTFMAEDEKSLRYLEEGAWRDFAAGAFGAGPACWPALGQLHADLVLRDRLRDKIDAERRRADAQIELMSPVTRQQAAVQRKQMQAQQEFMEKDPRFQSMTDTRRRLHRVFAEQALARNVMHDIQTGLGWFALGSVLTWPVLWVLWAFLVRGGLSYRIIGIDLVRANGRPALRVQCAWRALLVWAPIAGLLVLSLWLQMRFWADWERGEVLPGLHALSTILWYAALALPVVYLAVALARPARAPHDVLAGTYLVPR
jgi:hypothetical protein